MTAPTIRAVGAIAESGGAIAPGLPAGNTAGDLLIMFINTGAQAITVSGWTECPSSPKDDDTAVTRITAFYKIAAGSDATTTSDSGNHQIGRIIGITALTFDATTPFNTSSNGSYSGGTSVSIAGVTTTRADCLLLYATARNLPDAAAGTAEFSSWANASLADVTERIDNTGAGGAGGALGAASGTLAVAGASGTMTATAATSSFGAFICLAVQPIAANDSVGMIPIF
jgi:hypothetical protein